MHAWQPLLTDHLAARAWSAILEVAQALQPLSLTSPSLYEGKAGLALFYDSLAKALPEQTQHKKQAEKLSCQLLEDVAAQELPPSLFTGFSGVAWLFELQGKSDSNEEIDEALWEYLDRSTWEGDYELVFGLIGIGVYLLERLPRPLASRSLLRVLDHLEALAEQHPQGLAWRTPTDEPEAAYYHLGLAHGIAGVLAFLGRLLGAGIAPERVKPLVAGGVAWLLSQKGRLASPSYYPSELSGGTPFYQPWFGWCWGDPGIAAGLLVAARGAKEPAWEREALSLLFQVSSRSLEESGVMDAEFCHGAAGLAHILNRAYQATQEPFLLDAARRWFIQTLEYYKPGQGLGGFLCREGHLPSSPEVALPALLSGSTGIALSLLAAVSPTEPAWDRLFLLSPL